jgi:hypothetical protein
MQCLNSWPLDASALWQPKEWLSAIGGIRCCSREAAAVANRMQLQQPSELKLTDSQTLSFFHLSRTEEEGEVEEEKERTEEEGEEEKERMEEEQEGEEERTEEQE